MTQTGRRAHGLAGFTLVELMVVMILISLIMGISVPLLARTGSGNLKASARRLSGTVKYLFNEAALTGLEHRLVFDLDHASYQALRLEQDGELVAANGPGSGRGLVGDVQIGELTIAGQGRFTSGQVTARIDPSGWIDETEIELVDDKHRTLWLKVMSLSGTTEVTEGQGV